MRKIGIAALAVPLAVVGFAGPASAKPNAKASPEHVTITFDASTPDAPGSVVATGPISGSGTDTTLKSRTAGRTTHAVDLLTFGADSVTVKDVSVLKSRHLDAVTCTLTEKSKGVFKITKGTGAYEKAKGHGHFTVNATVTGAPDTGSPNGCNFSSPTGSIVVDATGRVKL